MIKKVVRKSKVAKGVIKEAGFIEFIIMILRFSERKTENFLRKGQQKNDKHLVDTKANYDEILNADYINEKPAYRATDKKSYSVAWVMPPPGKGSGGHLNIYRFIDFLEKSGNSCHIYVYTNTAKGGDLEKLKTMMGDSYPKIKAQMEWITSSIQIKKHDAIFATSWETAYPVFNAQKYSKKFYFVQDFEPYFYPRGSFYYLAENTYRFNFFGITAGKWLSNKLTADYGMRCDFYDFGYDNKTYYLKNTNKRKEIFFYARPITERRGLEMGILALDLFHKKHPDYVINLVGWDMSPYEIPFPYVNKGIMEVSKLNDLYNNCVLALVLSYTNMSLLPLELLGSGTIPVVNNDPNNYEVSNNSYINYVENNPISLADAMSKIVSNKGQVEYSRLASESVNNNAWHKSGEKFIKLFESEMKRNG